MPVCGDRPTIHELIDYDQFCGVLPAHEEPASSGIPEVTAEQLKAKMDRHDDFFLLDVREPNEYQICRIEGSTLIPLGELARRTGELDRNREMVILCKVGARSGRAVSLLQDRGFKNVSNLKGGIIAWIDRVDPSQTKY